MYLSPYLLRPKRTYNLHPRVAKFPGRQLLKPLEEKVLVEYMFRMSSNGYPLQVKHLRQLASVLLSRRAGSRCAPDAQVTRTLPGKN